MFQYSACCQGQAKPVPMNKPFASVFRDRSATSYPQPASRGRDRPIGSTRSWACSTSSRSRRTAIPCKGAHRRRPPHRGAARARSGGRRGQRRPEDRLGRREPLLSPAGTAEGRPLFFCAHMDTVLPSRPIEPVVEDGIVRNSAGTILGADNKEQSLRWSTPPAGCSRKGAHMPGSSSSSRCRRRSG